MGYKIPTNPVFDLILFFFVFWTAARGARKKTQFVFFFLYIYTSVKIYIAKKPHTLEYRVERRGFLITTPLTHTAREQQRGAVGEFSDIYRV